MDSSVPEMYVRVKREKQTVFVSCAGSDTVADVVTKVAKVLQKDATTIRLALGDTPLDSAAKLADAGVENDAVLRMGFLVNGLLFHPLFRLMQPHLTILCSSGEWESF